MKTMKRIAYAHLIGLLAMTAACATTMQTRSVEPSGFLGDYSQLREGKGKEAQLIYINESADFSKYTKILMDPIELHAVPDSKLANLDQEDQVALLNYFHASIHDHLQDDYVFVEQSGPGVMRLRLAVTEAHGSKPVANTISTLIPIGLAVSTVKAAATGTHLAVAETQAEMELLDSQSGERLAAAVDARAGRKFTFRFDKWSKYAQVRDAFDYWAERIDTRMAELKTEAAG